MVTEKAFIPSTILLGNAVKFTEIGSINVRIELAHHDDLDRVSWFNVEDSGIGIALVKPQPPANFLSRNCHQMCSPV